MYLRLIQRTIQIHQLRKQRRRYLSAVLTALDQNDRCILRILCRKEACKPRMDDLLAFFVVQSGLGRGCFSSGAALLGLCILAGMGYSRSARAIYNQINNGSAKKRREQGLDDTGFCDMQMIADWKLEIMCKHIIEEIWKDRNVAMKQACKILEKCYQADTDKQTENVAIQKKIDKLKLKIDTLIEMRSEGDISIEEYRNRRKRLNDELANYESKINEHNTAEEMRAENGLNWNKIYATLEKVIDITGAKVDNRFVEKFIARIVPQGNNRFTWYVNLSDVETKNIDIAVEGRKNHATVYIEKESEEDSEGEEPSVHRDVVNIRDILQFLKGKKYSPETTLHKR